MSEIAPEAGPVAFEKYHGTGNDFVVVDAYERVPDRGAFASRVCDREDGVGADGVLFLALEPEPVPPRVVMTLFQPDGGTAAMCGNGARCAAAWAMERTGSDAVMVDTQAGSRRAERAADGIAVEMGRPSFDPDDVPVRVDEPVVERPAVELGIDEGPETAPSGATELAVTAVDTGVPHAVAFVDDVDDVDLAAVAPPIRRAEAFPRGTNVTLASREGDGFRQRTYERGVEGETDACGTGAVAIAAAARRLDLLGDEPVAVRPPGGDLRVTADEFGRAVLDGPVVREFDGEAPAVAPR
ncbi:diaminopimelate epimerase [Halovivax sp.]|uniref:diaminopimelate epimerase n=1 Tax=Halovivax sp. TaxID=1935978 RepID=UPI0025BAAE32|nr:diaminopimelate epimerase [Halovivax sp.]